MQHRPDKFAAIDGDTRLELPPISIVPQANVRRSSHVVIDQGIATPALTIEWDAADKAAACDVTWYRDDFNWVRAGMMARRETSLRKDLAKIM